MSICIRFNQIDKIKVNVNSQIKQVIYAINEGGIKLALIVDNSEKVVGLATDGDVRRALLNGSTVDDLAIGVVNKHFIWAKEGEDIVGAGNIMRSSSIEHLPILDEDGHLVEMYIFANDEFDYRFRSVPVVIMAGGRGKRMGSITDDCPKPMIKVGKRPMIENIIRECSKQKFTNFWVTINYLGEKIVNHLKNGESLGVDINYVKEEKKLGTCGALSLLKDFKGPFVVMNADVLNRINLRELVKFHCNENASITTCVREYKYEIPFGVVDYFGSRILSITEKPKKNCFINAGIYVLDASVLKYLEPDEYCDMPELIKRVIDLGELVSAFPLHEYWIDVGNPDALLKAERTWLEVY